MTEAKTPHNPKKHTEIKVEIIAPSIHRRHAGLKLNKNRLKQAAQFTCKYFNLCKADINVLITGDDEITILNKRFLKRDRNTDVISFDLSDDLQPQRSFELIINAEMAARQAAQHNHSLQTELTLYLLHGLLHNLGFDDAKPQQADKMHEVEDTILKKLGFAKV